jgi:hypothetical protein
LLRHYCNKHRSNAIAACIAAALLQQALRQRCDAASACVVATLQQASWQRCGTVALQLATTAESNALCNDGEW